MIVILLLGAYLLTATELCELLKIPFLAEHFSEHKKINNTISLFDFLQMHYADSPINDGDADEDMKLPFKSHDNCASVNIPVCVSSFENSYLVKPIALIIKKNYLPQDEFIYSSFQVSIWQPPKLS